MALHAYNIFKYMVLTFEGIWSLYKLCMNVHDVIPVATIIRGTTNLLLFLYSLNLVQLECIFQSYRNTRFQTFVHWIQTAMSIMNIIF